MNSFFSFLIPATLGLIVLIFVVLFFILFYHWHRFAFNKRATFRFLMSFGIVGAILIATIIFGVIQLFS